jgi:hypothetical protein
MKGSAEIEQTNTNMDIFAIHWINKLINSVLCCTDNKMLVDQPLMYQKGKMKSK